MDEWTYLTRKSSEKGDKLKEANRQRMYTAAVKDLEFWLGEVSVTQSLSIAFVLYRSNSSVYAPYFNNFKLLLRGADGLVGSHPAKY